MPRLQSPFVHKNAKTAYAAYCAAPHAQRAGFVPPTFEEFKPIHKVRHAALAASSTTPVKPDLTVVQPDAQAILALIMQALTGNAPVAAVEPGVVAFSGRQRKTRAQIPADAARNTILWSLNTEGLLGVALALADEEGFDYITADHARAVMTENFGELVRA